MTAPTDTDRQRAAALILALRIGSGRVAAIATALAEERERARAPFLALADEYADRSASVDDGFWKRHLWIVRQRLYQAAEETR